MNPRLEAYYKAIGKRIHELRTQENMSTDMLAILTGMASYMIRDYESGEIAQSNRALRSIAMALETTIGDIEIYEIEYDEDGHLILPLRRKQ